MIRPKPRGSKPKNPAADKKLSTSKVAPNGGVGTAAVKRCVLTAEQSGDATAVSRVVLSGSPAGSEMHFYLLSSCFYCLKIKMIINMRTDLYIIGI